MFRPLRPRFSNPRKAGATRASTACRHTHSQRLRFLSGSYVAFAYEDLALSDDEGPRAAADCGKSFRRSREASVTLILIWTASSTRSRTSQAAQFAHRDHMFRGITITMTRNRAGNDGRREPTGAASDGLAVGACEILADRKEPAHEHRAPWQVARSFEA